MQGVMDRLEYAGPWAGWSMPVQGAEQYPSDAWAQVCEHRRSDPSPEAGEQGPLAYKAGRAKRQFACDAMALESGAFFRERAAAIGLNDATVEALTVQGWSTLGEFAFATPQAPGASADDVVFRRDVVAPALGEEPEPARVAQLRRLFFEAYTMVASDMRSRVERTDDDPPKKLPRVERENRIDAIRRRLPGARLTDEREPGASVVDAFTQMADDGQLRYVPWNKIISAKLESMEGKVYREWKPNRQGVISERVAKEAPTEDIGHDLMKLDYVLARRGVAMEAAKLLTFDVHRLLVDKIFEALEDTPPDTTRYAPCSFAQVVKADQEIIHMMGKRSRGSSIARRPDGSYPLEEAFKSAIESARIQMILQPLPRSAGKADSGGHAATATAAAQLVAKAVAKAMGKGAWAGGRNDDAKGKKGDKKGKKGDAKGQKGDKKDSRMPAELRGMSSTNENGENLCYAYNLEGCTAAEPGGRCNRGWHLCARTGCLSKEHGQRQHD